MDAIAIGDLRISRDVVSHPLLGQANVIEHAGAPITAMSAIDWDRPTQIPTIAHPRRLPRGAGTLLLNDLARRALDAGVPALRYAGPYPTHALFDALARSFRTDTDIAEFTRDVLDRAVRLARDELAIDFLPAPFVREPRSWGYFDARAGQIDRVALDRIVYDRTPTSATFAALGTKIVDAAPAGYRAIVLWGGPAPPFIAELDRDGELLDGPIAVPALESSVIGKTFPPDLRAALAEVIDEAFVPAPLVADVRAAIGNSELAWADLGVHRVLPTERGFALHAALWEHRAGLAELAIRLCEAVAPIAVTRIVDEIEARASY